MCRNSLRNIVVVFNIVCMLFFCVSCGTGKVNLPINDSKLIDILCDVHIMEAALQNRSTEEKDSIAKMYYQQVYEKHEITETSFLRSLELMEEHPKKLEKIYGQVLIQLDTLEERSYKSKYKKK